MGKTKLKTYYIEADGQIVRTEADSKISAMTAFHLLGYIVVWADVKLVPAWEKEKPDSESGR